MAGRPLDAPEADMPANRREWLLSDKSHEKTAPSAPVTAGLAADGHGGFRTVLRQWKQPRAPASAKDERENLAIHGHLLLT